MYPLLYPLRFTPIFQRYLWGGQRLGQVLHKPTGDQPAAESWEVVDHADYQSVVAHGPLSGKTLRQLISEQGESLLGTETLKRISSDHLPPQLRGRFPLLLKFLDANQNLSVQVHPDDTYGATLTPPDLGKTEAWVVMHADPGAKIYAGLKTAVSEQMFADAVAAGETESMLHSFNANTGDCIFIPAGTMHALGAGLLIAEIQQASNTTFRVYDWGRVEANGKPRPLHIDQAIDVTDFTHGPVNPVQASHTTNTNISQLIACDKFVMNKINLTEPQTIGGDQQFHLLAVTHGSITIENDPSQEPLQFGQTALLPAGLPRTRLTPVAGGAEVLEIHLP